MSDRLLDNSADTLPVGLIDTPFDVVYKALREVASTVWDVDPTVYRAGIAWGWYLTHKPEVLESLREILIAALISEQAPMVKDTQTTAELLEYLRIWRSYTPTYEKLQAIYATFGVQAEIQPISDDEAQEIMPVADRRLAFYIRVEALDWSRPLTLTEIADIALRATPLGCRPYPYLALAGRSDAFVGAGGSGAGQILLADSTAVSPDVPPTPTYTEITLYMQSGSKSYQTSVTSAYTGNVNSSYCYQLYTDEECTTPWTGYDYSNEYETGRYVDGEWSPYPVQKISDMPAELSTAGKTGRIILDTGDLWFVLSRVDPSTTNLTSVIVRIYPKDQQYYAAYAGYNYKYSNYSFGSYKAVWPWCLGEQVNYKGWRDIFPTPTFVKFLGAAGNEVNKSCDSVGYDIYSNYLRCNRYNYSGNINVRCSLYTLDRPTFYGWLNTDKSDKSTTSGTGNILYDNSGNAILYDSNYTYTVLGVFKANKKNCDTEKYVLPLSEISVNLDGVSLQFVQTKGTISAARIWYYKTPKPIETAIDVFLFYEPTGEAETFSANDYWGSYVPDADTLSTLQAFGVVLGDGAGNSKFISKNGNSAFSFEVVALYNNDTNTGANISNFSTEMGRGSGYYADMLCIISTNAYSTSSNKWKCRITKL